jgi:four helix bundle protein
VEEADESEYWLEIINDANLSKNQDELLRIIKESNEITKIMTTAKNSSYNK